MELQGGISKGCLGSGFEGNGFQMQKGLEVVLLWGIVKSQDVVADFDFDFDFDFDYYFGCGFGFGFEFGFESDLDFDYAVFGFGFGFPLGLDCRFESRLRFRWYCGLDFGSRLQLERRRRRRRRKMMKGLTETRRVKRKEIWLGWMALKLLSLHFDLLCVLREKKKRRREKNKREE